VNLGGDTLNWSQYPAVAVNEQGAVVANWLAGGIDVRCSHDYGGSWGPIYHYESLYRPDMYSYVSYLDDTILVAYCGFVDGKASVMFNKSSDGGNSWDADYWIDRDPYHSHSPVLAAAMGNYYAIWYDYEINHDTINGLYFSRWPDYPDAIEEENSNLIPPSISLSAYPNPFNSNTTITVDELSSAEIGIFDLTGRLMAKLISQNGKAVWDATEFSSGIYFARVQGGESNIVKLVLLK
jgi:hypothetical protein